MCVFYKTLSPTQAAKEAPDSILFPRGNTTQQTICNRLNRNPAAFGTLLKENE
jgi:hypothetical protein